MTLKQQEKPEIKNMKENFSEDSDGECKLVIDDDSSSNEPPEIKAKSSVRVPITVSREDRQKCLDVLYRKQEVSTMNPKKKYVCAVCKSVCDLFGLFLHMKKVHKGILCQYCLKLFKKVPDLDNHMKNAHKVKTRYFHSTTEFVEYAGSAYSLVCGICSEILKIGDLRRHPCARNNASLKIKQTFECPFCDRIFPFQNQLELHLCNGWCKSMTWLKHPTVEDTAKLYKVLTGLDMDIDYRNKPFFTPPTHKRNPNASNSSGFDMSDKDVLAKPSATNFITNNTRSQKTESEKLESLPPALETDRVPPLFIKHKVKESKKLKEGKNAVKNRDEKENDNKRASLVLKVPPPVKVKESKTERRKRVANEIYINMLRIKEAIDHFKDNCLFCQQTCLISVETVFLLSHFALVHDQKEVRDLLQEDPEDCITRIKKYLKDAKIRDSIFAYDIGEKVQFDNYRCCYCSDLTTADYSHLFDHLNSSHQQKVLTCHLCQNIFINYGSYLSHVCFGPSIIGQSTRAKFSCKVCRKQDLGSFLEFQAHLRKIHNICEICLHQTSRQEELYYHCQSHSQELMCMKCFLTYENRIQFNQHLYYKHEEEHKVCKTCHSKTWPHVYHFCIKLDEMTCEVCEAKFESLKQYRVHMRLHTGTKPYLCLSKGCSKSYVSRQLLWKHQIRRHDELRSVAFKSLEDKRVKRELQKYKASCIENVQLCKDLLQDLLQNVVKIEEEPEPEQDEVEEGEDDNEKVEKSKQDEEINEPEPQKSIDPIDLAVQSIMGPEGTFSQKSPIKSMSPLGSPPPPMTPTVQIQHSEILPPPSASRSFVHTDEPPLPAIKSPALSPNLISQPFLRPSVSSPVQAPVIPRGARVRLPIRPGGGARILRPQQPQQHSVVPLSSFGNVRPPALQQNADATSKKEETPLIDETGDHEQQAVVSSIWNQDLMSIGGGTPSSAEKKKTVKTLNSNLIGGGGWELNLSDSSDSDGEGGKAKKPTLVEKPNYAQISLLDHDYCYDAFLASQPKPKRIEDDLTEMGKILSNVAMGANDQASTKKNKKKKKKKRKKKKKKLQNAQSSSASDSEKEVEVDSPLKQKTPREAGPRPKYHMPGASTGVTAGTARPRFSSSEDEDNDGDKQNPRLDSSDEDLKSSDLDTDFEADELLVNLKQIQTQSRRIKPSAKAVEAKELTKTKQDVVTKPSLKLKIKLPPKPPTPAATVPAPLAMSTPLTPTGRPRMINTSLTHKSRGRGKPSRLINTSVKLPKKRQARSLSIDASLSSQHLSKKMRESLALNQNISSSSSDSSSDSSDENNDDVFEDATYQPPEVKSGLVHLQGGLAPGMPVDNRLYCVCQCPHDDVSEMIGCDAPDCRIEWFHFECVGVMVPPEGKWYCPECSKRYKIHG